MFNCTIRQERRKGSYEVLNEGIYCLITIFLYFFNNSNVYISNCFVVEMVCAEEGSLLKLVVVCTIRNT